jgi:hypothetical protein
MAWKQIHLKPDKILLLFGNRDSYSLISFNKKTSNSI